MIGTTTVLIGLNIYFDNNPGNIFNSPSGDMMNDLGNITRPLFMVYYTLAKYEQRLQNV